MQLPEFKDVDALSLDERLRKRDRRRLMLAGVAAIALHVGTACAIAFAPAVKPVEPPGEMEISIDLEPAMMSAESASAGEAAASAPQAETPPVPDPVEEVAEETPPEPAPPEPTPPEPEEVVEPPPPEPPPPEPVPEPVEEVVQPEPIPEPLPEPTPEPLPEPPKEIVEAEPPPPAEAAEVVLPPRPKAKPKPVVKPKVERAEKVEKPVKPKPKAKPKPASASSAAAASRSERTDIGGSGAKADPSELARYIGRLRSALERRKRYPSAAGGVSGTASLSFTINRSGQVTSFHITRSSGNAALDAATRAMVQGASLPAIPGGLPGSITVGVPVNFSTR
jgi:protein TonB